MGDRVTKHGEVIPRDARIRIANRYHTITKAINKEFWNSCSETTNSIYVGSYGRGTAIDTSDIDVLVELPQDTYERFDYQKGNGQSRLLQAVKTSIQEIYSKTDIHADGQVVVMNFSDGMRIEIVPAFRKIYSYPYLRTEYLYPDSNNGGNWKSTNPKEEQSAMREKNRSSNGLLMDTCKHIRRIRNEYFSSYHLSGILIDSFVYRAIGDWHWINDESEGMPAAAYAYENSLIDYYNMNKWSSLYAPGSNQLVDTNDYYILEKVLKYMVK